MNHGIGMYLFAHLLVNGKPRNSEDEDFTYSPSQYIILLYLNVLGTFSANRVTDFVDW